MASGDTAQPEPGLTPAQVRLLPLFLRVEIGPDFIDVLGHMNIRWYMALYDDSAWAFFASFGMDEAYFHREHAGAFALQQFIRYLAEVHAGDTVAIHTRLLGYSDKFIHFMAFMVNETQDRLASTIEGLVAHADTSQRRITAIPSSVAEQLAALLQAHNRLDWPPPMSGAIRLR